MSRCSGRLPTTVYKATKQMAFAMRDWTENSMNRERNNAIFIVDIRVGITSVAEL